MLRKVKMAMRIASGTFDEDIERMILECKDDLRVAGVTGADVENGIIETENPLIQRAIITFCKMNTPGFASQYDALKASYDEQKAQLSMHTGTTDWGD